MTGLNITSNKQINHKLRHQDKYNLKRIDGIKDKGVKINMLMRLIGKRNQEIKHLKIKLNKLWINSRLICEGLLKEHDETTNFMKGFSQKKIQCDCDLCQYAREIIKRQVRDKQ